ncbi:unnamed protein product [Alternaria sp. RS040]
MFDGHNSYRCIGKGFCGSVWIAEENSTSVVKREDGGPGRSITNDYNMHLKISQSIEQHFASTPLAIPQCYQLIQPSDLSWWDLCLRRFPTGYEECRALISERIPKVPRSVSDKIVDLSLPENPTMAAFVQSNKDDDDCLIRPYLGRRRGNRSSSTSRFQRFSLRNVALYINQMEDLGLDVVAYATTMADALALMYWGAGVNVDDVEFVLAPPRPMSSPTFASKSLGEHVMWVLDFDRVKHMSMDEDGLEQACAAFFRNDPYYPRPDGTEAADDELWDIFKARFLGTSLEVLGDGSPHLDFPQTLVRMIEQEGHRRLGRKQEIERSGSHIE